MSPKIHVYAAPAEKFFVNSFLIETATGEAGHGQPGTGDLFDVQRRYIEDFRNLIIEHAKGSDLTVDTINAIIGETARGRDGWPLAGLIAMSAQVVAEELVSGDY